MTTASGVLLAAAVLAMLGDWVAVATGRQALEYICKPLVMVALIATAGTLDVDSSDQRLAFVIALVFSLGGDVALMMPADRFVIGLGSFLIAHVAYIAGFALIDATATGYAIGAGVVLVLVVPLARRYVGALARAGRRDLLVPVILYMVAIGLMVASAIATGNTLAIMGATLFFVSDALIAETRFVGPRAWGPMAIIVTYHLAQVSLVLSLAS